MGVMVRAWARGWKVCVVQFIKSPKWKVGERKLAQHLELDWFTMGDGFTWESTDMDETMAKGRHAWQRAADAISSGDYDMVILDEGTYAMKYGWVEVADVVECIKNRPDGVNVILTGRYAADELIELADTVTDMTMVKHGYKQGFKARKGIEY